MFSGGRGDCEGKYVGDLFFVGKIGGLVIGRRCFGGDASLGTERRCCMKKENVERRW
jgi:hypothetical protein